MLPACPQSVISNSWEPSMEIRQQRTLQNSSTTQKLMVRARLPTHQMKSRRSTTHNECHTVTTSAWFKTQTKSVSSSVLSLKVNLLSKWPKTLRQVFRIFPKCNLIKLSTGSSKMRTRRNKSLSGSRWNMPNKNSTSLETSHTSIRSPPNCPSKTTNCPSTSDSKRSRRGNNEESRRKGRRSSSKKPFSSLYVHSNRR